MPLQFLRHSGVVLTNQHFFFVVARWCTNANFCRTLVNCLHIHFFVTRWCFNHLYLFAATITAALWCRVNGSIYIYFFLLQLMHKCKLLPHACVLFVYSLFLSHTGALIICIATITAALWCIVCTFTFFVTRWCICDLYSFAATIMPSLFTTCKCVWQPIHFNTVQATSRLYIIKNSNTYIMAGTVEINNKKKKDKESKKKQQVIIPY